MNRIFLLSPAHAGGRRAAMLKRPAARFELARRLQIGDATLGEVFAFCSGLYFRGKLTYARCFARPPSGMAGCLVITPSRGLVPEETALGLSELEEFATVPVDPIDPRFALPLARDAARLATLLDCEVILLGSIATGKYVDVLLPILGSRLLFPEEFVGRGDMSRGGLMLRCAAHREELTYRPLAGAARSGKRARRISTMPLNSLKPPALESLLPRPCPPEAR